MLSIGALGQTTYHTMLAQTEYFSPEECGERPGVFVGKGAELLGLRGTVPREQFKSLMQGSHPETRESLRQTAGKPAKYSARDDVEKAVASAKQTFGVEEET